MITMMFWNGAGWAWWQAGLMWVGMIAFWGLLIWAVYAVVTNVSRRPDGRDAAEDPHRILSQRLARGEITPAEYERLTRLIDADGQSQPPASEKPSAPSVR
jgi:putative membrane protein